MFEFFINLDFFWTSLITLNYFSLCVIEIAWSSVLTYSINTEHAYIFNLATNISCKHLVIFFMCSIIFIKHYHDLLQVIGCKFAAYKYIDNFEDVSLSLSFRKEDFKIHFIWKVVTDRCQCLIMRFNCQWIIIIS